MAGFSGSRSLHLSACCSLLSWLSCFSVVLQHREAAVVSSPGAAEGSAEAEFAPAAVLADSRSSQGPGALQVLC